eukprot:COSAG01_NODE_5778_length_4038_cov_40.442244_4_plen_86_part_00
MAALRCLPSLLLTAAALRGCLHRPRVTEHGWTAMQYTARGSGTCQGRPGSLNYEYIDAATYCDWGLDYIKIVRLSHAVCTVYSDA